MGSFGVGATVSRLAAGRSSTRDSGRVSWRWSRGGAGCRVVGCGVAGCTCRGLAEVGGSASGRTVTRTAPPITAVAAAPATDEPTAWVTTTSLARSRSATAAPPAARDPDGAEATYAAAAVAEQGGCEQPGEVRVDVGELQVDGGAGPADLEVVLETLRVTPRDPAADVAAEVLACPGAGVAVMSRDVHGEERLTQTLPRAVGEGGDRVGAHAEQRSDLARLLSLDLRVPQHQLPPLRQGGEGPRSGLALEALDSRVVERHTGLERGQVVGEVQPGGRADAVDMEPSYGGQQVGAEGQVGAAPALEHHQDLGEGLGDEIVGVGAGDQLPGESAGGLGVSLEERAVRLTVPTADGRDELGVGGALRALHSGCHTGSTNESPRNHASGCAKG